MRLGKLNLDEIEEKFSSKEKTRKPKKTNKTSISGPAAYFKHQSCVKKKRFHGMEEAKDFITRLRGKFVRIDKPFDELRIYHCTFCNGFHLTNWLHEDGPPPAEESPEALVEIDVIEALEISEPEI